MSLVNNDVVKKDTTNNFTSTFILDKPHFAECYAESMNNERSLRDYAKAIFFIIFSFIILMFTEVNKYAAWFLVALGFLEAVSVYYQAPWWVTRQMLSKASGSEVTLTINEQGIHSKSFYIDSMILWNDVNTLNFTERGLLIKHNKGINYISSTCLSEAAIAYLESRS
jgi:hypothetical protein